MIRILIADDHLIFRQALRRLLTGVPNLVITAEAASYGEALNAVRRFPIDVVVVDLTMPGRDGVELIKQLKELKPSILTLALTMHTEKHYIMRALRAGVDGYLTKECAGAELVGAIRKLVAEGRFVSPAIAESLTLSFAAGDLGTDSHNRLSGREFKVLGMVASGKRGTEIAKELSLSKKTVSTHKANIMRKLNLQNAADLVRYAVRHGLISLDGAS